MKKLGSTLLTLLLLPSFVFAQLTTPRPTGFVNDSAGLLTAEQEQILESGLTSFEQSTGNEIAVLTVTTLEGDNIERYAEQVFTDWGLGKKGVDNGVLLLIALEDRKMRIEVGYGLEGVLTDSQAGLIISNILRPAFIEEDYNRGITEAVTAMKTAVSGGELVVPSAPSSSGKSTGFIFEVILFFLATIGVVLARTKSIWLGGVLGFVGGGIGGYIWGGLLYAVIGSMSVMVAGLLLDLILSRTSAGKMLFGSHFGSGGSGRGGFGGFGGGSSGGGGASGSW